MSCDLGGRDPPRIVLHHTEAVVQRHGGGVHARKPLQGEPCGCGATSARHFGDVKPNRRRVRSLDGGRRRLRAGRLDSAAAEWAKGGSAAESSGEQQRELEGRYHWKPPNPARVSTTRGM